LSAAESRKTPLDAVKKTLGERREEIVENKILTLEIPDYEEPPVEIRFRPVPHDTIVAARKKIEKAPKKEQAEVEVRVNADLLVKACDGITSGDDSWSGFGDPDLATELGVTDRRAISVCRALYVTEGDLISHAWAVSRFSGYKETEIEEDLAGE
jgi:hypothetical protein